MNLSDSVGNTNSGSTTLKFDFTNIDESKKEAICTTEGPLLIIAGPGTGKTYTIVKRAVYLITECGVSPKEILMTTFSEKAANELITRITDEMVKLGKTININEMYIGTIHNICLKLLKENLDYTRLKNNYRIMDDFDQRYCVYQNFRSIFSSIPNFEEVFRPNSSDPSIKMAWVNSDNICSYVNKLTEEMVDVEKLANSEDIRLQVLAETYRRYQKLLQENNLLDFASIQCECLLMLKNNLELLDKLRSQIKYLMIDEYQDTNYIQEQFVFLLGGQRQNICVVGDDDQSLYRFRGATVRNILEFPAKFEEGQCKIVHISENYRSNPDIVDFYNRWMKSTDGDSFSWTKGDRNFRYDKTIVPHNSGVEASGVAVLSVSGKNAIWHESIYNLIQSLKNSGKITDYNQIAFLFRSVRNRYVKDLVKYLENRGVNVYSPRSDMFFERYEVRIAIGLLACMFRFYVNKLVKGEYSFQKKLDNVQEDKDVKIKLNPHQTYIKKCIDLAKEFLDQPENAELKQWIVYHGRSHDNLLKYKVTGGKPKEVMYAFTALIYQMFRFEPFKSILGCDLKGVATDSRGIHNLAILTQILARYEYLHDISVLTPKREERDVETLFNFYLKYLRDGGIQEYEDDSNFAPSGCVSFMTIHQSKGLEFPIVVVGSLDQDVNFEEDDDAEIYEVLEQYYNREPFEPHEYIPYFDLWRLYYTAFSRPKNLLILTCPATKTFSSLFRPSLAGVPDISEVNLDAFDFATVKDTELKDVYSFTSHISVYDTCPLQYKFFKELEFSPVRDGTVMFGTLVHAVIEDIHKAAIRGEFSEINETNISKWLSSDYATLLKKTKSYLDKEALESVFHQVMRYVETEKDHWSRVREAEVDVSYVMDDYIMEGKIDLLRADNDSYEIVDFKSSTKPDMLREHDLINHYKQQLIIYAYLIEKNYGKKVNKMHLYFTGAKDGLPYMTVNKATAPNDETIEFFNGIVHKIKTKEYSGCAKSGKTCKNCDFRFYCEKF